MLDLTAFEPVIKNVHGPACVCVRVRARARARVTGRWERKKWGLSTNRFQAPVSCIQGTNHYKRVASPTESQHSSSSTHMTYPRR